MSPVSFDALSSADLLVDGVYEGGRRGNAGDDPFPALLSLSNQGGFRYRGDIFGELELIVLTSNFSDPDWPDALDRETGVLTYFGDNKKPGRLLHETGRRGNLLLQRIFTDAQNGHTGRSSVPPILVFSTTGTWRDVRFLGLAVPGSSGVSAGEDLVAIWRATKGKRFQNYRARFTVLDAPVIGRDWLRTIINGNPDHSLAPGALKRWVSTGERTPLLATRSLEYRSREEQSPSDDAGESLIRIIRKHFDGRPHRFEHFAAALTRLMIPDVATLDITRPSRDGGRDGVGQMRVGTGPGSILVDFALEAKCYTPPSSVGVRDMSRLISRLRHRQFGVLVTTTWVDRQAYREIKEDRHPIIVIAAADIASLLKTGGWSTPEVLHRWLDEEFGDPG